MRKRAPWYDVLLAARRIVHRSEILTSLSISKETGLEIHTASAWLGKFYRWGYALKAGTQRTKGRPAHIWGLTDWGLQYKIGKRVARPGLRIAANPRGNQG